MNNSDRVLRRLREEYEHEDHPGWGMVYLDNARAGLGMTDKSFRSHLAQLSKEGLYRVVDGYAWGEVKIHTPC
jgi:hypothetical protein